MSWVSEIVKIKVLGTRIVIMSENPNGLLSLGQNQLPKNRKNVSLSFSRFFSIPLYFLNLPLCPLKSQSSRLSSIWKMRLFFSFATHCFWSNHFGRSHFVSLWLRHKLRLADSFRRVSNKHRHMYKYKNNDLSKQQQMGINNKRHHKDKTTEKQFSYVFSVNYSFNMASNWPFRLFAPMDVSSIYGEPFAIQIKMVSNQISF